MSELSHFVYRDLRDHKMLWALFLAGMVSIVWLGGHRAFNRPGVPITGIETVCGLFFLFYTNQIWNSSLQISGLSRLYQLSLPLARNRMFLINLLRGALAGIPLATCLYLRVAGLSFHPLMEMFHSGVYGDRAIGQPVHLPLWKCLVFLACSLSGTFALSLAGCAGSRAYERIDELSHNEIERSFIEVTSLFRIVLLLIIPVLWILAWSVVLFSMNAELRIAYATGIVAMTIYLALEARRIYREWRLD